MIWSTHSLRIELTSRSAYPLSHGERGDDDPVRHRRAVDGDLATGKLNAQLHHSTEQAFLAEE